MKPLLKVFGLLLYALSVLMILDGLLPMRSHGPNPHWPEVVVGLLIWRLGWFCRRDFNPSRR